MVLLCHPADPCPQGALQGRPPTLRCTAGDSGVNLNHTQVVKRPQDIPDSARTDGQALVEFALVLIPLMLILGAVLQFAFILGGQLGLTNAAREGARFASVSPTTSTNVAANATAVIAKLEASGGSPPSGLLARNVQAYVPADLVTTGLNPTQVCYTSYQDESGAWSVRVKVDVVYDHPLFIPLISSILDGSGGNKFRVSASEEMRVENPPAAANPGVSGCYS